jgi:outer membrane protein assembly factor BamB
MRTTLPVPLLVSRLPKESRLAEQLLRPGAPRRLDLDAFDAEVKQCGVFTAAESKALKLTRKILAAQPLDTERGRALEAATSQPGSAKREASPVRSAVWSVTETETLSGDPCLSRDGKTIFQLNSKAELMAFARVDGAKLWSLPLGGGYSFFKPQLSVDGKRMLITTADSSSRNIQQVSMVDLEQREVLWKHEVSGWPASAPATFTVGGGALVQDHGLQSISGLDPEKGEVEWEVTLKSMVANPITDSKPLATPDGSTVIFSHVCSAGLNQTAIDAVSGDVRWSHDRVGQDFCYYAHGLTPDGKSVLTTDRAGITCYAVDTGDQQWRIDAKLWSSRYPPVFSPDGTRMAINADEGLYVFEVATGKQLYGMTDTWTYPAKSNEIAFTPDGEKVVGMVHSPHRDYAHAGPTVFTLEDQRLQIPMQDTSPGEKGWTTDGEWGFVAHRKGLESIKLEPPTEAP